MDEFANIHVEALGLPRHIAKIDAELLIENVRRFPHLYNSQHADYKDTLKKNNSWRAIGTELKCSAGECQKQFKGLKETYMKERRKIKTYVSGAGGQRRKVWTYYGVVDSLLGAFQDTVETQSNVDLPFLCEEGESSNSSMACADPGSTSTTSVETLQVPYQPWQAKKHDPLEDMLLKSFNETNEDTLFGQSVGKTLQRLSDKNKALAKIKIMQILYDAEE